MFVITNALYIYCFSRKITSNIISVIIRWELFPRAKLVSHRRLITKTRFSERSPVAACVSWCRYSK